MQQFLPDPTAPNVAGVPQSHNFFHPHFSNHANVLAMSDTFNIGVIPLASMAGRITPLTVEGMAQACAFARLRLRLYRVIEALQRVEVQFATTVTYAKEL